VNAAASNDALQLKRRLTDWNTSHHEGEERERGKMMYASLCGMSMVWQGMPPVLDVGQKKALSQEVSSVTDVMTATRTSLW
jgi:hypothetical protein